MAFSARVLCNLSPHVRYLFLSTLDFANATALDAYQVFLRLLCPREHAPISTTFPCDDDRLVRGDGHQEADRQSHLPKLGEHVRRSLRRRSGHVGVERLDQVSHTNESTLKQRRWFANILHRRHLLISSLSDINILVENGGHKRFFSRLF